MSGEPLYGTCSMSTPAAALNSSPEKCASEPLPPDAYVYLPGLALASATSSGTDLIGESAGTTSTDGVRMRPVIGTKSFKGS